LGLPGDDDEGPRVRVAPGAGGDLEPPAPRVLIGERPREALALRADERDAPRSVRRTSDDEDRKQQGARLHGTTPRWVRRPAPPPARGRPTAARLPRFGPGTLRRSLVDEGAATPRPRQELHVQVEPAGPADAIVQVVIRSERNEAHVLLVR